MRHIERGNYDSPFKTWYINRKQHKKKFKPTLFTARQKVNSGYTLNRQILQPAS